jgi:anti-anti-sigma regulatory factor
MDELLTIELASNVTIAKAEDLLKEFREVFILGRSIKIDASKVEKIDTACLQLIASLKKSLELDKHGLLIENASDTFRNSVAAVALTDYFELN